MLAGRTVPAPILIAYILCCCPDQPQPQAVTDRMLLRVEYQAGDDEAPWPAAAVANKAMAQEQGYAAGSQKHRVVGDVVRCADLFTGVSS